MLVVVPVSGATLLLDRPEYSAYLRAMSLRERTRPGLGIIEPRPPP